ncbi:hypothetical protein DSUL_50079 [Desulfovibrionales bacterium]
MNATVWTLSRHRILEPRFVHFFINELVLDRLGDPYGCLVLYLLLNILAGCMGLSHFYWSRNT